MKKYYALLLFIIPLTACFLSAFSGVGFNPTSAQLIPTPTLGANDYVYAILTDNNALLYCSIVREPIPDIFQTASAAPTRTPTPTATSTTVGLQTKTATPIWITPEATGTLATPTEEAVSIPTIISSPTPITMTVISGSGLNVRQCPAGVNPSTTCPVVRVAKSGDPVNVTHETYEASTITWRRLTDGNWIAEIINDVRVLGI